LRQFNVLVVPFVSNNPQQIVNGLPMNGPPIPWRRSALTPNLGGVDSTDDVRPGIGLDGMAVLNQWIAAGGVVITEGGTAGIFTEYGVTRGVDIAPARQLRASGGIYRAVTKDPRSPSLRLRGYAGGLLQSVAALPGGYEHRRSRGSDPDLTAQQARSRPRVVLSFHQKRDSLRLSGLLGQRRGAGRSSGGPRRSRRSRPRGAVCDQAVLAVGDAGSFALVFNTILNWNDLGVAWPTLPKPNTRAVAAPDDGP